MKQGDTVAWAEFEDGKDEWYDKPVLRIAKVLRHGAGASGREFIDVSPVGREMTHLLWDEIDSFVIVEEAP